MPEAMIGSTPMNIVGRYASRKFILAMATLASATWLVYSGRIADGVYSAVVIATVGAYIVGNVSQKVLAKDLA